MRFVTPRTAMAAAALALASPAHAQPALTPAQWRADLRALADGMPRLHPNLFKWTPRARFDSAVGALDARIPSLNRDEILVEMMKIVSLPADGHTSLLPLMNPAVGFHRLPLRFYRFSDGLFVKSADPRYASIVGGRVTRIGRLQADSAYRLAAPLVPRENPMWELALTPELLAIPEVLHAIGATSDASGADIVVAKGGTSVTARVLNEGLNAATMGHDGGPPFDAAFIDAGAAARLPVSRAALPRMLGVDWLPDSRVLYVQYNAVANAHDMTVAQLAARITRMLDSLPVEKLALDIRLNPGGNDFLNRPLTRALIGSKVDQRGKLFVIIGRQTFSAAQLLTNDLERFTDAIFVGEPTGSRVNFFGDHEVLPLPNSRIPVMVSQLWWQRGDARDVRQWKAPEIFTPLSAAQYAAGIDPALDAVIAWRPENTAAARIRRLMSDSPAADLAATIRDLAADPQYTYSRIEPQMNTLGYELLNAQRLDESIRVFEAITRAFPSSANAFDSLGEALERKGDAARAIASYERALALDAGMSSSRTALARLKR